MKLITSIFYYLLVAGITVIGLFLLISMVPIPGNFDIKVVKSGSMEPAIKTGAIVAIFPAASYGVGDVITFGADTKTQIPTTHRIVEVLDQSGSKAFHTKGDANDAVDPVTTKEKEIEGRVIFTVPYAGYLLDFARKPLGFALLVGVPALAVIIDEVMKISREISKSRGNKKKRTIARLGFDGIKRYRGSYPVIAVCVLGYASLLSLSSIGSTLSYYNDGEVSQGNTLAAGAVDLLISVDDDTGGEALVRSILQSDEEATGTESFLISVGIDERSLPLIYTVTGELDVDAPAVCKLMTVDAVFGSYSYAGFLTGLASPATSIDGDWLFTLTLPQDDPRITVETECKGGIIFSASAVDTDEAPVPAFTQVRKYTFELYGSDTATSTPSSKDAPETLDIGEDDVDDETATTTPDENATSTEEVATSTADTATSTIETASSTPEVTTDTSTSTPFTITVPADGDTSSTTPSVTSPESATSTPPADLPDTSEPPATVTVPEETPPLSYIRFIRVTA